jgi:hypothetical protein
MTSPKSFEPLLLACCLSLFAAGCDQGKPESGGAATAKPTATPAATPTPAPAATPAPTATSARPAKIDTELNDARRAAIESKYASAKGFLVAKELEEKLKSNKAIKDKKAALTAFDKLAKGKWLLFSGPLVNLTDEGFDMGIVYTKEMPNDPMGMSRQFFEVTMTEIEGYSKDKFKAGNVVVVLTKYTGAGKASPGHELVSAGAWQ